MANKPMTARQLREALGRCPEEVLDRPVTWNSEYVLGAVVIEDGGCIGPKHVVLDEAAKKTHPGLVKATQWYRPWSARL